MLSNKLPLLVAGYPNFQNKPTGDAFPAFEPPRLPAADGRVSAMRVCMVEPGEPAEQGSMGARYVLNALHAAGFRCDHLAPDDARTGYDVELVSVHHCTDFVALATLPRRAPVRLVGGHPTTNNIRPAIPFADAFCIGEGEEWVGWALSILEAGGTVRDLARLPGTVVRELHKPGDPIPKGLSVVPLPMHPPYLNRAGEGHARVWYIEMARGCPFKCSYCELGHAWKYRPQKTELLLAAVDSIDKSLSNKVSLFAPDEASHPGYGDVLRRVHERGLVTSFGSMRLDRILKQDLPLKKNMLIRVGLDGLSEATRMRVNKPIKNADVIEYFRFMTARGHVQFKMFMVFGYPWETAADFDDWVGLMHRIRSIPRTVNANVRIKFTPLIPQPSTPLADAVAVYDDTLVAKINNWFEFNRDPPRKPGWHFYSDGIMSRRSHDLQCRLTRGDENTLLRGDWQGTSKLQGYDVHWHAGI